VFLAAALYVVSAIPAAAQTDAFSAGLAFLSDNGGVGVNADYSKARSMKANDRTLGWVGDVAINHKGFGGLVGSDFSINTFMVDGGLRLAGKANDKATWHVQGTAGIMHASASIDNLTQSACDLAGVDCSPSATSFMIMPSGAVTYWFSGNGGVKAQLNIPIAVTGDGSGSSVRFDINYVRKLGK
jgi:hypothetical protein